MIVRFVRLLKFTVLFTVVNWSVSSALKISSRISNFAPCAMPTFFEIDRSRLLSGGSRAKNRGVSSPLLPGCGGAKHSGWANCLYGSPLHPRPGSQVRAIRAFGLPSVPVRFLAPIPGIKKLMV